MRGRSYFFLSILLFARLVTLGQHYYFRHYLAENGLSHNTVLSSCQDSSGFIWLGTRDGLDRFDGINFKIFRNIPGDSSSLGNNYISALFVDREGHVWIGTGYGIFRYVEETETFQQLPIPHGGTVWQIREDSRGILWFIMNTQVFWHDPRPNKTGPSKALAAWKALALCPLPDGTIWFSSNQTLIRYDPLRDSSSTYRVPGLFPSADPGIIGAIQDCGHGKLLLGTTTRGILSFDIATGSCKSVVTYNPDKTGINARAFIHDTGSVYWAATETGIFVCDLARNTITNLKRSYDLPYSLSDNSVYGLCKDREGGIWAGTYYGGVNYLPKEYTPFDRFMPGNGPEHLSGNVVREICQDRYGNIWVGTEDNGLNKIEHGTGKIVHYLPGGKPGDICYSDIEGILPVARELWISTYVHGLDIMDIPTGKVIRHIQTEDSKSKTYFYGCLYQTRSGDILAGSNYGLVRYDPSTRAFQPDPGIPGNIFINHILEDGTGIIWLGTAGDGLYRYNPVTQKSSHFLWNIKDSSSISSDAVSSIFEDHAGVIWLTTDGGGLCRLNKETGTFTRFGTREGWPSNFTLEVLEDDKNKLWVSTTKGLVWFDPATASTKVYTQANGLLSDQFNYNSGFRDTSGNLYFGGVKGMIRFRPDAFLQDSSTPPVYITGFQANGRHPDASLPHLQNAVRFTQQITLPYNQSSFSLDFASLSYAAPGMTRYTYRLQGLDDQWMPLGSVRSVSFQGLSPGTYVFDVKARGGNGLWSNSPAEIVIEIQPPYWETSWAYLFYVLAVIIIAYVIMRGYHARTLEKNRIKMAELQHEKDLALYQTKIDFFTYVAHEIKTPVTLINGPLDRIISNAGSLPGIQKSLSMVKRNTEKLMQLVTELLDFRDVELKGFSLRFSEVNVSQLLNDAYTDFKPLAGQKGLSLTLSCDPEVQVFADAAALDKIIKNLLGNAVKYAARHIEVNLQAGPPGAFTLEVASDGVIIAPEQRERIFEPFYRLKETRKVDGTGLGLALSRMLAELHAGHLYLRDQSSDRNVFVLTIPLVPPANAPSDRQAALNKISQPFRAI
jgi:signal transduction histidine kinase/ligand-binding sensor domain-containing protein